MAQWRSERIAGFVQRARNAAHEYDVELLVDVRSPRDGGTAVYGQDYGKLYDASDGLVVWYYPGLGPGGDGSGWTMSRTVSYLRSDEGIDEERVVLSVGLWANGGTLPADRLGAALRQAEAAGFTHRWVTPYSLLGDEHVAVLTDSPPPAG